MMKKKRTRAEFEQGSSSLEEKVEQRRVEMVSERQAMLESILDTHDDLVRERFHLEKFVTLIHYDPHVAKLDESEVFKQYKAQYDLLALTNNDVQNRGRKTRSARQERMAELISPLNTRSTPKSGAHIPPFPKTNGKMQRKPFPASPSSSPLQHKANGKVRYSKELVPLLSTSPPPTSIKGNGRRKSRSIFDTLSPSFVASPSPPPLLPPTKKRKITHSMPPDRQLRTRVASLRSKKDIFSDVASVHNSKRPSTVVKPSPTVKARGRRGRPKTDQVAEPQEESSEVSSDEDDLSDFDNLPPLPPNFPRKLKLYHRPTPFFVTHPEQRALNYLLPMKSTSRAKSGPKPKLTKGSDVKDVDTPTATVPPKPSEKISLPPGPVRAPFFFSPTEFFASFNSYDSTCDLGDPFTYVPLSTLTQTAEKEAIIRERAAALRKEGRLPSATLSHLLPSVATSSGELLTTPVPEPPPLDTPYSAIILEVTNSLPSLSAARQSVTRRIHKAVNAHFTGARLQEERRQKEEIKRMRTLAKSVGKSIEAEWKKAVWHINQQVLEQARAEEARLGKIALDEVLERSGQLLGKQQDGIQTARAGGKSNEEEEDSDDESQQESVGSSQEGVSEEEDGEEDVDFEEEQLGNTSSLLFLNDIQEIRRAVASSDDGNDTMATDPDVSIREEEEEPEDVPLEDYQSTSGSMPMDLEASEDEITEAAPSIPHSDHFTLARSSSPDVIAGATECVDSPGPLSPAVAPSKPETAEPSPRSENEIDSRLIIAQSDADTGEILPAVDEQATVSAEYNDRATSHNSDTDKSDAVAEENPLDDMESNTSSIAPAEHGIETELLGRPLNVLDSEPKTVPSPSGSGVVDEVQVIQSPPGRHSNEDVPGENNAALPNPDSIHEDRPSDDVIEEVRGYQHLSLHLRSYASAIVDYDPKAKIEKPLLLRGDLRPYQQGGLEWLATLHSNDLNGILADEMGLGKTIQTIALLAHLACDRGIWGPHLIIVPTSVILNWEMEFKKFLPGFRVLSYHGSTKRRKELRVGWNNRHAFNVCVTSYTLASRDAHIFKRKPWYYLILDEAHMIKNFKSQRWNILLSFRSHRRLLLTGTPLQNNLTELWSLLRFLMSGANFVDLKEFGEWFANPLEKAIENSAILDQETQERVNKLHTVLRPFLLRRLKVDVEKELPNKYEHIVMCRLSKRQRFLYDEFMQRAQTREALASGVYQKVANILMQLRKVCNHPDLFEVRPIITSFAMGRSAIAQFEIKELLIRRAILASHDKASELNLDLLGLRFVGYQEKSIFASQSVSILDATDVLPVGDLPPEPAIDIRTVNGYRKRRAYLVHLQNIERQKQIKYLNRLRCHHFPVFGCELLQKIRSLCASLKPESSMNYRRPSHLSMSRLLPNLVKSYSARAEQLLDTLKHFAVITPSAVVMQMPSLALAGNDDAIYCHMMKYPGFDAVLHEAAVRLQIAFPDPGLLQYDCGKLQELARLLYEKKVGGHRVLIFTQMTKILDILEIFLNFHGWLYLRLDGATKIEDRQYATERFNADARVFAFIASSRSGGVGVNLTGADTVIFFDSDFNPQMDRQCEDRAHRIGQIRDVHIYRFISEHTVEESIFRKANQKRSLDDVVIQQGEFDWRAILSDSSSTVEEDGLNPILSKALGEFDEEEDARAAQVAAREEDVMLDEDMADFEEAANINGVAQGKSNKESTSQKPPPEAPGREIPEEMDNMGGRLEDVEEELEGTEGGSIAEYMLRFVKSDWEFFSNWKV